MRFSVTVAEFATQSHAPISDLPNYNLLIAQINQADRSLLIQLIFTLSIDVGSGVLVAVAAISKASTGEAFRQKRQELVEKLAWTERSVKETPCFTAKASRLGMPCMLQYFADKFDAIADFSISENTSKVSAWRQLSEDRPSIYKAYRSRAT